jgi:sensor histidine kinase YesM
MFPTLLIQPFVENAIHHGILMKSDNSIGKIVISIYKTLSAIKVEVEDNGIGRKASQSKKVSYMQKNKESSGIEITKNRILLINEIEKMKFDFNIIDLVNEFNEPLGTKVAFTIPIQMK